MPPAIIGIGKLILDRMFTALSSLIRDYTIILTNLVLNVSNIHHRAIRESMLHYPEVFRMTGTGLSLPRWILQ
jgi:hypothetical protein